jgi:hypothetical protein
MRGGKKRDGTTIPERFRDFICYVTIREESHLTPFTQVMIASIGAGLPTLTVLVGILINNQRLTDYGQRLNDFERRFDQRINDLEKRIDQRFTEQRDLLRSEMFRMEQVLDARLKHLEENLH